MPPHLRNAINQAQLENGTYEQIFTHLERELELSGLEAPDELQLNTVNHDIANLNADTTKPPCHYCKKPGHYRNHCRLLKKQRDQTEKKTKIFLETKRVMPIPLTRTALSTILTTTETVTEPKES